MPVYRVTEAAHARFLVHQEGQHGAVEVPVHAIVGFEVGTLRVSVNRRAMNEVDDEETRHRLGEES